MKFRLIQAYTIKGLIGPSEQKFIIDNKDFKAFVISNPDESLKEIDKKNAIANLLLTSTFIGRPEGDLHDIIESRISDIKKQRPAGCYLIIDCTGELEVYRPSAEKEHDGIHIAFDAIDGVLIREQFKNQITNTLITLTLHTDKIIGMDKITDGILIYKDDGNIIYSLSFKGGNVSAYLSSPFDIQSIEIIAQLYEILKCEKELNRVTDLLATSLQSNKEPLKAFLTCWTALEIFVNKYFKSFEREFFNELKAGEHPEVRERYLNRIYEVMSDKYKLNDKFGMIALRLSPSTADKDANIFNRLKKQRDDMAHGQNINESELDVVNAQKLLTEYLKLFLYHRNELTKA